MTEEQFLDLYKDTAYNINPSEFYWKCYKLYWNSFTRGVKLAIKRRKILIKQS